MSVIVHGIQKKVIGISPRDREEYLGSTPQIRDGLVPHDQTGEHSGDDTQGVADLRER